MFKLYQITYGSFYMLKNFFKKFSKYVLNVFYVSGIVFGDVGVIKIVGE